LCNDIESASFLIVSDFLSPNFSVVDLKALTKLALEEMNLTKEFLIEGEAVLTIIKKVFVEGVWGKIQPASMELAINYVQTTATAESAESSKQSVSVGKVTSKRGKRSGNKVSKKTEGNNQNIAEDDPDEIQIESLVGIIKKEVNEIPDQVVDSISKALYNRFWKPFISHLPS